MNTNLIHEDRINIFRSVRRVTQLYRRFSTYSPFFRASLLPVILTFFGIVCLALKPNDGVLSAQLIFFMVLYLAFSILKVALDYNNALHERRRASRVVSLESQIKHLDECVREKARRMSLATRHATNPSELLRKARGKLQYENAVTTLNKKLATVVCEYLESVSRVGDAQFVFAVLQPNEDGEFIIQGRWEQTGGTRSPKRETGIFITDMGTVAGRLWVNNDTKIFSCASTKEAEENGLFKYLSDDQRGNLKSIFCYRVDDVDTGLPIAIWSIDADEEGVFPDKSEGTIKELSRIVDSFGLRLSLEYIYDDILNKTSPIYEKAILNHEKEADND